MKIIEDRRVRILRTEPASPTILVGVMEEVGKYGSSMIITIDGPAGSGKSSVARAVARELGVVNLNTGAAYRAVALISTRESIPTDDAPALADSARRVTLDGDTAYIDGSPVPEEELRSPEVSAAASRVSSHPEVRGILLGVQRDAARLARSRGGAVVEGRDIGTVVLPDAELKVFLSASEEERARRRAAQSNREWELERIREAMRLRDRQDAERKTSPLKPADDAVIMDTTTMSLDEVVGEVLRLAKSRSVTGSESRAKG